MTRHLHCGENAAGFRWLRPAPPDGVDGRHRDETDIRVGDFFLFGGGGVGGGFSNVKRRREGQYKIQTGIFNPTLVRHVMAISLRDYKVRGVVVLSTNNSLAILPFGQRDDISISMWVITSRLPEHSSSPSPSSPSPSPVSIGSRRSSRHTRFPFLSLSATGNIGGTPYDKILKILFLKNSTLQIPKIIKYCRQGIWEFLPAENPRLRTCARAVTSGDQEFHFQV